MPSWVITLTPTVKFLSHVYKQNKHSRCPGETKPTSLKFYFHKQIFCQACDFYLKIKIPSSCLHTKGGSPQRGHFLKGGWPQSVTLNELLRTQTDAALFFLNQTQGLQSKQPSTQHPFKKQRKAE